MSLLSTVPCFIGEHSHNIDAKGRIIIPAKFRDSLGAKIYVTKGLDNCLKVYTPEAFGKLLEQINALPSTNKAAREYQRFFLGGACECEVDSQGRILIPTNLIAHATLKKECVIVGCGNTVEIWSLEKWNKYNKDHSGDIEDIAESLTDFLI